MPHLSRPQARHLTRSRHGIWYVRWVVPADLRQRFPQLPRELKRSTGSANVRVARRCARDYLGQWLSILTGHATHMPRSPDSRLDAIFGLMKVPGAPSPAAIERPNVAPLIIERNPATGRITRAETHPHDTPEALALLREELAAERAQLGVSSAVANRTAISSASMQDISPTIASRWLGEAIDDYFASLMRNRSHDANTLQYAHGPSLKIFRELISENRRVIGKDDAEGTLDIQLALMTQQRMDQFLKDFGKFPSRQGMRHADAKSVLANGGKSQSQTNAIKRLRHIGGLLEWLKTRKEIDPAVLGVLQAEMAGMPARKKRVAKQPLTPVGHGSAQHDGYVAFSREELARLFHPDVYPAHVAGKAARYWIPLLGRYTGCRINELAQAWVRDVQSHEGLTCLVVTPVELDAEDNLVPEDEATKRVKTDGSCRAIPLHPELIRLGFLKYVEERKEAGEKRLFDLTYFPKDGYGKDPGRDFRSLIKAVGVWQFKRKVFHSFRATINQALVAAGLEGNLIDRFLGHSVKSTRAEFYSRNDEGITLPIQLVHAALCKIPTVDTDRLPVWVEVRKAPARHLRPICIAQGFVQAGHPADVK